MKSNQKIEELLSYFNHLSDFTVNINKTGVINAYQSQDQNLSLPLKIIAVLGGVLSSIAFVAFLFVLGIEKSGVLTVTLGILFTLLAIFINKMYRKISIHSATISFYLIGFILIAFGINKFNLSDDILRLIFISISLLAIVFNKKYLMSFFSILIISGCIFSKVSELKNYYVWQMYLGILTISVVYIFFYEAKILTNKYVSKLFNPLKIAIILTFLATLIALNVYKIDFKILPWLSLFFMISATLLTIHNIFKIFSISKTSHQLITYFLVLFTVIPTVGTIGVLGAMLLILLGFWSNHKTSFVLGIISFVGFIIWYYYDLKFTLLTKSVLLFISGVFFLILYAVASKKINVYEEK